MKGKKRLQLVNERGALTGLGFWVCIFVPILLWSIIIWAGMTKIGQFQTQEVCVGQEIRISTDSSIMDSLKFPAQLSILDKTDNYISFVAREAGTYHIGIDMYPRYYIKAKEGTYDSCIILQNYSYFWVTVISLGYIAICFLGMIISIFFMSWITGKKHPKQE